MDSENNTDITNQDNSGQTALVAIGSQIKPGVIDPRHLVVPVAPRLGDMFYSDGTVFKKLSPGATGQVLTLATGIPSWKNSVTGPTGPTGSTSFPSIRSNTSSANPMPAAIDNVFELSAQAVTAAFAAATGTPTNGQPLQIIITSSNSATARALTWSTATGGYAGSIPPLPSTTNTGASLILNFTYMSTNAPAKYRLWSVATAA